MKGGHKRKALTYGEGNGDRRSGRLRNKRSAPDEEQIKEIKSRIEDLREDHIEKGSILMHLSLNQKPGVECVARELEAVKTELEELNKQLFEIEQSKKMAEINIFECAAENPAEGHNHKKPKIQTNTKTNKTKTKTKTKPKTKTKTKTKTD